MFEMGFVVALGLLVVIWKMPWRAKLWMFSHPLLIDGVIFVGLTIIHWGTFSGVMVATIGAFLCSCVLGAGRRIYGYNTKSGYQPGWTDVRSKL